MRGMKAIFAKYSWRPASGGGADPLVCPSGRKGYVALLLATHLQPLEECSPAEVALVIKPWEEAAML